MDELFDSLSPLGGGHGGLWDWWLVVLGLVELVPGTLPEERESLLYGRNMLLSGAGFGGFVYAGGVEYEVVEVYEYLPEWAGRLRI